MAQKPYFNEHALADELHAMDTAREMLPKNSSGNAWRDAMKYLGGVLATVVRHVSRALQHAQIVDDECVRRISALETLHSRTLEIEVRLASLSMLISGRTGRSTSDAEDIFKRLDAVERALNERQSQ